ncbi:hypothetical protein [Streptomyces lushanensis]|uniref:hypothetical protein n=1 Tax=Streptomyces lushanensis TaxID=1434255 RepID=UPI000835831A|nr:hypothetical protein [Streptomyces lushanensis]
MGEPARTPGAGAAHGHGHGHEDAYDDERELRILLERAVPRLPAPEERLSRVRERVRRARRRRRTGGAAAAAVTGLMLAGTFLPGALRGGPEPLPPAAPGPSVTERRDPVAGQDPTGGPDPAPTSSGVPFRFEHVAGLTLRLPEGWQAVDMPGFGGLKSAARGYASSERLTAYGQGESCPKKAKDSVCVPLQALAPGGALLTLTPVIGVDMSGKIQRPPELYASAEPSEVCRGIRGTREYAGLLGGSTTPVTAVGVTLCVSGDAPGTVEDVRAMVTGADFGKGTVTTPPAAPPPTATAERPPIEK